MAITANQAFNFIQGSDITGESSYDIWKKIYGGTEAEFAEFLRSGPKGDDAHIYAIAVSDTVIKKDAKNVLTPASVTFNGYYRIGTAATRYDYSGRFMIEESTNGINWETKYTSVEDEASVTYVPSSTDVAMIKCHLYTAGDTTDELDVQNVAILSDVANLEVGARNLLSNSDIRYTITKDSNETIDMISIVNDFDLQRLVNKSIALSFYADTVGEYTNADDGTNTTSNKFGMIANLVWSDSTGVNDTKFTQTPLSLEALGVNKERVYTIYDVTPPNGYDTIDSLTFHIILSLKPDEYNDNVWVFERPKLEVGTIATQWTLAPEDVKYNLLEETKNYTDTAVANLVNGAPEILNTIGELATAFIENKEVVDALNEAIAKKQDKDKMTTSLSSDSTDDQYPTAKAVFDHVNTKVFEVGSGIVQSDYEQNDDTQKDYIKNRPFYHIEEETLFFEEDIVFDVSYNSGNKLAVYEFSQDAFQIKSGELYSISIDGNVFSIKGGYSIELPSEYHSTIGQILDFSSLSNAIAILFAGSITNCHLKICQNNSELKQIDEKFIPDISKSVKSALANNTAVWSEKEKTKARETIGVIQSDWNQTDENQIDFIKNKTHYTYYEEGAQLAYRHCPPSYTSFEGLVLEKGKKYVVYVDGERVIMECGSSVTTEKQTIALDFTPGTAHIPDLTFISTTYSSASHEFGINEYNEIVVPLDEKFLPNLDNSVKSSLCDSVWTDEEKEKAKTTLGIADTIQPDWNQNDETASNYIKNRTHYDEEKRVEVDEYFDWLFGNNTLSDELYNAFITKNVNNLLCDGGTLSFLSEDDEYIIYKCASSTYPGELKVNKTQKTLTHNFSESYGSGSNNYVITSCHITGFYVVNELKPLDDKFVPDTILRFEIEETLEIPDDEDVENQEVIDDGNGNVTLKLNGVDIIDDGNGNVTLKLNGVDIIDDGNGNVTLKSENMIIPGDIENMEVTDDDNGNVTLTLTNVDIIDDDNGNVTIKSENMEVTDDGNGNVKINI